MPAGSGWPLCSSELLENASNGFILKLFKWRQFVGRPLVYTPRSTRITGKEFRNEQNEQNQTSSKHHPNFESII